MYRLKSCSVGEVGDVKVFEEGKYCQMNYLISHLNTCAVLIRVLLVTNWIFNLKLKW